MAVIQNTNHLPGIVFNCQVSSVYHSNVDNHHSETYWSRAGLLTLDYALFAGWSDEYRRLIYKDSEGFLSESKFGSKDISIMPSNLFYHRKGSW